MPEYSGISFVSKILAFLDPQNYCVLDQQLARLANMPGAKALGHLVRGSQIRITKKNQSVYDLWRQECQEISNKYFRGKFRVVDIERGFFSMVQNEKLSLAQKIYSNA